MADQFCLRWNNFQTNIVSALDSLKCSEDLVDVTLTCEGRNIKAHKVILSACSPYFRNVFKENPCQHPVIILKDVSADDIVSLLSYMYQGEVFIEESKLSSFLHTAALLQVKGLTGVTQQDNFTSPNTSNKLYTQLTISSKSHFGAVQKDAKLPALKKRRSSTSDKPNDVTIGETYKRSRLIETCDIYNKNSLSNSMKVDNPVFVPENNIDKKNDGKNEQSTVTANGKSSASNQVNAQGDNIPVTIKTERIEDSNSPVPPVNVNSENDDSLPDYENSMLARSLLSGINPSKSDVSANNSTVKKVSNVDIHCTRPKDATTDSISFTNTMSKSPLKISSEETVVKSEKHSPKSEIDYEPEVLLSEQHDGTDSDNTYSQEQSQALLLLAGMSSVPVIGGASTSGLSHQQSNHAAICGDCPHCGMKYSNQSALKYHVRLMHSDLTNRLCCYLCPRSFTMRETFKEHMWTSHGQRN
ncbi:broad-complex core protein isoforms 1/2/3/4/5-like isoform X2 [Pectinophora gossypiella]|uniref:broad-complex core protein isoforms 1/2/3/4/5-like isoform X2 n=1 Tax=Pectinophora gossypiella TaxID=13191 RepID=UPI00214EDAEC|nr:broad-complex core protein isoforms 1/2/3/4/5-like isoform X2 [Pectinophora gossypiella]